MNFFQYRKIPTWLAFIFVVIIILISVYIPTKLMLRPDLKTIPGPYVSIFDIPYKVYLVESRTGDYFTKSPVINHPVEMSDNPTIRPLLVAGIDYEKMAIQYLGVAFLFLLSSFLFKKEQNTFLGNQKNSAKIEDYPPSLLLVTFHLSANVNKVENMNYKEKLQRLIDVFEKEKFAQSIAPCIWVVETKLPCWPEQYQNNLLSMISGEDRIIVVPLTYAYYKHLQNLNKE